MLTPMAPDRDLFANFERMRREIDELFGDVFGRVAMGPHRRAGFTPPVDLSYREDPPVAVATFALPGIRIEELELEIEGRELRISGHRRPAEAEGSVYQQIEIEHGPFRRVVALGADVVAEETHASYQDGMLRVEMPLARREARARPVPIELGGSTPAAVRPSARGVRRAP
jgi:HSP20 family protein